MNKLYRCFLLLLVLCVSLSLCLNAEAEVGEIDGMEIAEHMRVLYDYMLPEEVQQLAQLAMKPTVLQCGDVLVNLNECIYDGIWLYTAASITPVDSDKTLIMPGDAEYGDLVAGHYHEEERDDTRTFSEAAIEDGKELVAVYVYPAEFNQLGSYFYDSFQRNNNETVLLSGAEMNTEEDHITINWAIEIYRVDTMTGNYTSIHKSTYPMEISILRPLTKKDYYIVENKDLPFDKITLIQSGLTVYTQVDSCNPSDIYFALLFNENGVKIPFGAPPAINSFILPELPKKLTVQIINQYTGITSELMTIEADE